VVKRGIVMTPKKGVLAGTTRRAVMRAAARAGIKIRERDFTVRALKKADEVFITNAPRGIIPVSSVDGVKIGKGRRGGPGTGCPGAVTKRIIKAFEQYIWQNI
jgi:branched-chain amino acid aminotransferase